MTARRTMDDAYRGGRVTPEDDKPKVMRYPCSANSCPMPGTIFVDQVLGEKVSGGLCAWHYGAAASDWPRITQVFTDWACVSAEVEACRAAHCDKAVAADLKALSDHFAQAVARLRPAVQMGGWGDEFEPQVHEDYRSWGKRLEAFIGGKVVEVMAVNQRRAA